jgi:hypothetical protein
VSILLSLGRFGGFYFHRGYTVRVCLGWIAFTFIPGDDDWVSDLLDAKEYEAEEERVTRALRQHVPGTRLNLPEE